MAEPSSPSPSNDCLSQFGATLVRFLGGRNNLHWLVSTRGGARVLRRFAKCPMASVAFEYELLRRLRDMGWPVSAPVAEPIEGADGLWGLFELRPGTPRTDNSAASQRIRGKLLAELHRDTATLVHLGQRPGFTEAHEVLSDPLLGSALRRYERDRPEPGRVLRWHFDKTIELISDVDLDGLSRVILHGDFAPWNLLYEAGELTGVIDFEAAHLNWRVSDFALSWRGYQDDVIAGYEDIHALSDADRQMILPAFWAWLYRGVRSEIEASERGLTRRPDFDWQIRHLLLRPTFTVVESYKSP